LPEELKSNPGVICFSPVPLMLTTNMPSESPFALYRSNTIRFPFGDQSPGTSSPPGWK
jgi:hypothetical protein